MSSDGVRRAIVTVYGSQTDAARALGVSTQAVTNWVNQGFVPDRVVPSLCKTPVPLHEYCRPDLAAIVEAINAKT